MTPDDQPLIPGAPAQPEPRKAFTKAQRRMVYERQDGLCACGCGKPLGRSFEIDHIQQRALLGKHEPDNWRGLTPECHKAKSAADAATRAHVERMSDKHFNGRKPSKRPIRSNPKIPARPLSKRKKAAASKETTAKVRLSGMEGRRGG